MARGGSKPFNNFRRGSSRGRGRGRGGPQLARGGSATSKRNGFKTSRVQDIEEASEGDISAQEPPEPEDEDIEESQSASEDETPVPRQSYSALLQVLKASHTQDEPVRKKRKLNTDSVNGQVDGHTIEKEESEIDDNGANIEEPDAALAEDLEVDADESADDESGNEEATSRDPFELHFAGVEDSELKTAISASKQKKVNRLTLDGDLKKQTTLHGSSDSITSTIRSAKDLHVKGRLDEAGSTILKSLSKEERDLAGEIVNYRDVQYGHRTLENISKLRNLACLHALNHVFKTRDRVLKNNAKISQSDGNDALDLRDQGFTRPKVLFIVPTKQACVRFVDSIATISEPEQQENKSRFRETFSQEDDDSWENKTEDFRELFGGNHEEDFRVGLKFTRKTIKYFSGFYNSDIIFGSALGLMRTITTGGGAKDKKKGHDADFLSSIEIVIVDHAAAIQMQNFQHLEYIFSQLNLLPKDSHGCDFARVRNWYLDGHAKHLRQTILFTSYHTPELNSLFSKHTHNTTGIAKYTPTYAGAMLTLPTTLSPYSIPQTFLRFDSPTPHSDTDARFKYFATTILPHLLRRNHSPKGTLIFVPTYLDFVRLRNHFSTSTSTVSLNFGSVSEYTSVRDTARARSHFMNGRHSVLLYSERAHHHFRYRIKGVRRVVFYGVPENPVFWGEVVGFLGLDGEEVEGKGLVRALFSRWDVLKLERVVGTERVGRLVGDRGGDTFEFV